MENKFTKGKWELDADFIFSENDEVICDTNPIGITKTVFRRSEEEFLANGRLIAAAPELLNALIGVLNIMNDSEGVAGYHLNGDIAKWDEFDEIKQAEQAIKKATE